MVLYADISIRIRISCKEMGEEVEEANLVERSGFP
jgi:hypothetical protein